MTPDTKPNLELKRRNTTTPARVLATQAIEAIFAKKGTDIIFIPSIFSGKDLWKECLSFEELKIVNDLKMATNDIESLLDFSLGDKCTIKTAIHKIASQSAQYHHLHSD